MSGVVRVRVAVYEDDIQVSAMDIGYFRGQDYTVQLVTPDGVDGETVCVAGEPA